MKTWPRLAAIGLLGTLLLSCNLFDYSNLVVHKYALIYGVTIYSTGYTNAQGGYTNAGPNLQYPDSDASAMALLFTQQNYVVKSRWVDSSGHSITTEGLDNGLVGKPATTDGSTNNAGTVGPGDATAPTKANILADIQSVSSIIGPNDVLVVYFSGHGTQDTSVSPPHEYFDPYDGVMDLQTSGSGNYYDWAPPSVRDDDLRAAFDAIKTPRKVLILDTCNSGGFIGNQLEADWTPPVAANGPAFVGPDTLFQAIANYASMQSSPTGLSPYGAQVLSAAGRDESCYETPTYSHGVMTYWLLQGLQGGKAADLNHDGHVTALEAFAYAKAGVDQNWNKDSGVISAGYTFEPHVSGGPVDFELF